MTSSSANGHPRRLISPATHPKQRLCYAFGRTSDAAVSCGRMFKPMNAMAFGAI